MKKSTCYFLCLFVVMFLGCVEHKPESEPSPKSIQSTPLVEVQGAFNEELDRVLEQKTWVLESYGNPKNLQKVAVQEGSEMTAIFNFASASIIGYGGCNWYKARFEITGDTLAIEPQFFTRRACLSPDMNKQEHEYFKALEAAERYRIEENQLQIFYAEASVLNFKGSDDKRLLEHVRAVIPVN